MTFAFDTFDALGHAARTAVEHYARAQVQFLHVEADYRRAAFLLETSIALDFANAFSRKNLCLLMLSRLSSLFSRLIMYHIVNNK